MTDDDTTNYRWDADRATPSHGYLAPAALDWIRTERPASILDLGCGDGRLTAQLADGGFPTTGADFSAQGIARAQAEYPQASFFVHALDDPLPPEHRGLYPAVTAIEVIEHLLLPRHLFARADEALTPGGRLLVTTPYHGYWKNLAIALTNRWDQHHSVRWDYGHVKFFSPTELRRMGEEEGFRMMSLARVGRIPVVASSMVAVFERQ